MAERTIPGDPAMWPLIGGDMLVFGFMFVVFAHDRAAHLAAFQRAHNDMSAAAGVINTILLLTSSWFVAAAVKQARVNRAGRWPRLLWPAIACGMAFVVVKFFEYRGKIAAGITPQTSLFFTYYFTLTGIHLLHVLLALTLMTVVVLRYQAPRAVPLGPVLLESAATFWHLVDLLWIMLFALFYLLP